MCLLLFVVRTVVTDSYMTGIFCFSRIEYNRVEFT